MPRVRPQRPSPPRAGDGAEHLRALPTEAWFPVWLGPPLIAAAFVALARWSWRKWPDVLIDFGSQLYIPWQLAEGRALYLDIDYKDGPLSQYLNALWFSCFGVSLRTLIWCNLALLGVLCVLVYVIFARACGRFTATLVVLVQLAVFSFSQYTGIGNYNYVTPYAQEQTHGVVLAVAMIFALGEFVRHARAWWLPLAGGALGLAFLTKTELFVPALAAAALGLALAPLALPVGAVRPRNLFLAFGAGAVVPVTAFVAFLATQMPLQTAIRGVAGNWLHLRGDILDYPFYRVGMGMDDPLGNLGRALWVFSMIALAVGLAVLASWMTRSIRRWRMVWSLAAGAALCAGLVASADRLAWSQVGRALPFTSAIALLGLAGLIITRRREPAVTVRFVTPVMWAAFALVLLAKVVLNVRISHYGFVLAMPATLLLVATLSWGVPTLVKARIGSGVLARALLVAPIVAAVVFFLQWSNALYAGKDTVVGEGGDAIVTSNRAFDPRGYAMGLAADRLRQLMPHDATLMVVPDGLMLNYWLRRANPTRHIYFVPWSLAFAGGEAVVLREIQQYPPDFIAIVHRSATEYGFDYFGTDERYGAPIMRWIRGNYQRVQLLGAEPLSGQGFGILILARSP